MGAQSSSTAERVHLKEKQNGRPYRLPSVRQKDRFNYSEASHFDDNDGSTDKFDYLIVFPLTESDSGELQAKVDRHRKRIIWKDAQAVWRKAVGGTENSRDNAVKNLEKFWELRTKSKPKDNDALRFSAWCTIARETIIEQLNKAGLQLKLSSDSEYIFCRIRAPIALLEMQADRDDYNLQFRGEIDPGSEEFWNVENHNGDSIELEEEKRLLSLNEAKGILERLYRAGKISPVDLLIDPEVENQEAFTRRVHALERIADKVPVSNLYPAYASFLSTKPHLRYLYQTYPSARGPTLFRSKDRLLLTKSVIDSNFDIDVLAVEGLTHSIMALHDANRGERLTTESLSRKWVTFWNTSSAEAGSPYISHPAYEDGVEISWWLRPFAQPLPDIREYYGEKVGMYFAWLGYFTYALIFPACLGIAAEILMYLRGYVDTRAHLDWPLYGYALLMITWAVVYEQSWHRECYAIALKWGTRGFESEEKDRPEFVGEPQRSEITNKMENHFPEEQRKILCLGSYGVISLCIIFDLCVFVGIFYGQYYVLQNYTGTFDSYWFYWVANFMVAFWMQFASFNYKSIATHLNSNENHRTDTEFEDALVLKVLFFEIFNSFGACVFTGFFKNYVFNTCYKNCVEDLRLLLYAIIMTRVAKTSFVVVYTFAKGRLRKRIEDLSFITGTDLLLNEQDEKALLREDVSDDERYLIEFHRVKYQGTFNDFADAYMQFTYINLFSVVMPILSVISLCENLVKLRMDAYKLCFLYRRPHVLRAEDAGYWTSIMGAMELLGVWMSMAIFTLAEPNISEYSLQLKIVIFTLSSQCLVVYVLLLKAIYVSEPDEIQEIAARHQFIVDKYAKGFDDDDDAITHDEENGMLTDCIAYEAHNIYDLKEGLFIPEETYAQIEQLEKARRDILKELDIVNRTLKAVYNTEVFNDATGVGETRHGLPLGRLHVNLVEVHKFQHPDISTKHTSVYMRVSIVAKRSGVAAPAPAFGDLGKSTPLKVGPDGYISMNQVLGPFAPVRTIDADVVFELMSLLPSDGELTLATTSIHLKELEDQKQHDLKLQLKIRDVRGQLIPLIGGTLYVNLTFHYSKVIPVRNKVYYYKDKLQTIDQQLVKLRSNK